MLIRTKKQLLRALAAEHELQYEQGAVSVNRLMAFRDGSWGDALYELAQARQEGDRDALYTTIRLARKKLKYDPAYQILKSQYARPICGFFARKTRDDLEERYNEIINAINLCIDTLENQCNGLGHRLLNALGL